MNEINKLIGQSVVALKGNYCDAGKKRGVELAYILFSDKETYIILEEQDGYSYHDCSMMARIVLFRKSKDQWQNIYNKCPDVTCDGFVM